MKIVTCLGFTACVLTAACGGGGGASSLSYDELAQKYLDLAADLDAIPGAGDLAGSELPDSGGAKYAGVMTFTAGPTVTLAGTMALDVDFASERISGSATNFRDASNIAFVGTLEILEDDIAVGNPNPALPTYVPILSGTLTSDTTTVGVLGSLTGDAFGTDGNPAFMAGTISGSANVDGDLYSLTATSFLAERTETN